MNYCICGDDKGRCIDCAEELIDKLTAENAAMQEEMAKLFQYRTGHLPDCAGMDRERMICGCGYLDGTAYRAMQAVCEAAEGYVRLRHGISCLCELCSPVRKWRGSE